MGEAEEGTKEEAEKPLFQISGNVYDSERAYLRALLGKALWASGKLRTGELERVFSFDRSKAALCRKWEQMLREELVSGTQAVAALLCEIAGGLGGIFDDPAEIGDILLRDMESRRPYRPDGAPSYDIRVIAEWLRRGDLEQFAAEAAAKGLPVKPWALPRLAAARSLLPPQKKRRAAGSYDPWLLLTAGYALSPGRRMRLPAHWSGSFYEDRFYESPASFLKTMREISAGNERLFVTYIDSIREILKQYLRVFPDPESRKPLTEAAECLGLVIFGDADCVFRSSAELKAFISDLITRKKRAEFRDFFWRCGIPLEKLRRMPGFKDIPVTMEEACPDFFMAEDMLFFGEDDFREYLAEEINRGREKPENYAPFVLGAHARRKKYESIAREHPALKPVIDDYFAAAFESAASPDSPVCFGSEIFPDMPSFAAYLKDLLENLSQHPDKRADFFIHRISAVKALSLLPRFSALMQPFLELAAQEEDFPESILLGEPIVLDELCFSGTPGLHDYVYTNKFRAPFPDLWLFDFAVSHRQALKDLLKNKKAADFASRILLHAFWFFPSHIRLNGLVCDLFSRPGLKKGDTLTFGRRYLGGGEQRDLEWLALDVFDIPETERTPAGKAPARGALIISRYPVFFLENYEDPDQGGRWNTLTLNDFLNQNFLNNCFSESEVWRVLETKTAIGAASRIFCLGIAEAERYFGSDAERVCLPDEGFSAGCAWWLRSKRSKKDRAPCVAADGSVMKEGCPRKQKLAVRPAMRIILDDVFRA